jgi:hypothetical protein
MFKIDLIPPISNQPTPFQSVFLKKALKGNPLSLTKLSIIGVAIALTPPILLIASPNQECFPKPILMPVDAPKFAKEDILSP